MTPITDGQESQATKRKREVDEQGKRKRTKKDKAGKRLAQEQTTNEKLSADVNGVNDGRAHEDTTTNASNGVVKAKRHNRKSNKKNSAASGADSSSAWKVSQPMGGRILNIDPLLTNDEKHMILPYNTSLQVYSTADSLLLRKIELPLDREDAYQETEQIMAICLSPISHEHLWVASSTGRLWRVDWASGGGLEPLFDLDCMFLSGLAVEAVKVGKTTQEVPYACVGDKRSWRIVACNVVNGAFQSSKTLMEHDAVVQKIQVVHNGFALAASADSDILVGHLKSANVTSFEQMMYEFFVLDCSDEITCMDVRATERIHLSKNSRSKTGDEPVVEVAVGCARGSIFYYNDLLPQIRLLQSSKKGRNLSLQPRKSHWHRRAVHGVKWSRDGNYIISGGSESTLVLWQLDTGKLDFLPHLSATIENIVVSARGSSYVIHLDDNSAMIITTAEMKPTTYVSGVQTHLVPPPFSKDELVQRIGQKIPDEVVRIPAAINPTNASHLLMCVGNGQHNPSTPMIQTVDLSTIQSISKQALTRTNPTDVNVTPKGYPIVEPQVTGIVFSYDGKWLATTDEWEPPTQDINQNKIFTPEHREVYLKIWSVSPEDNSLELIARVNNPHSTDRAESVLGLAADSTSHRFATIGADGFVRTWRPIVRQRDGVLVKGKQGRQLHSWTCSQSVAVYEKDSSDGQNTSSSSSGAVCFSQDGSILVAAHCTPTSSAVHVIDAETGEVRNVVSDLIEGAVQGVQVIGSQLIVLSDMLAVYDLVSDELSYGIQLRVEPEQMQRGPAVLTHLAVDYTTAAFAVAVSRRKLDSTHVQTELAIFSPERSEPEMIKQYPYPISAVVPAVGSGGFIIVDAAAQLWSVSHGRDTQSAFAQPLVDLSLDKDIDVANSSSATTSAIIMEADEEDVSDDEMDVDMGEAGDEDELHPVVVAPQKLTELFDGAPAFAMPPIEDMFYQVTRLFSTKKAVATSA